MKTGIYKITSPKGRIYIGQSKNINSRINRYKKLQCCKTQLFLYRSFLKYRVENHKFEIIDLGNYTKKELNKLETEYIVKYNSFNSWKDGGLNLTTGGDSYEFHQSVKDKMSKTRLRKIKEGQYNSKLTIKEVKEIKKLLLTEIKQVTIAKEFKVSKNLITEIKKGRAWSQIKIN